MKIPFYDDYFSFPDFSADLADQQFKDQYIRRNLCADKVYKFVGFDNNAVLNQRKLDMLSKREFWASCYTGFCDKRELYRRYDIHRVAKATQRTLLNIHTFFSVVDEVNDISCFTYKPSDRMWSEYANFGNGFCMEFALLNTDKFFPVVYLNKDKIDYTNDIIQSFQATDRNDEPAMMSSAKKLSILPWVLKDMDYTHENEVRFLCGDVYDDENGPMGGRIAAGKKEAMGYKGIAYSFDYAGLSLNEIIVGANCSNLSDIKQICKTLDVTYRISDLD